ncbi:unnamed protein product [marine sediment metagenome]|uniref:Tyr recombinase domain-containing protein n=1 Tax=marine sediment metagenome TaxID=412755 RepID=X1DIQ4_9ZZZZ
MNLDVVEPLVSIQDFTDQRDWSKSMVNVSFYALKWFFEKQLKKKVEKDFFINRGRESTHEPRILDREEVGLIFGESGDLDLMEKTMLQVGWEAALRRGELVGVKGENMLDDGVLDVRVLKTKRARKRVKLYPETYEMMSSMVESPSLRVFKHFDKYGVWRSYTPGEWSGLFAGWSAKVLKDEGLRWHDFARHTRLTHYAEDTKSFIAVLQLSGHQNPRVCRQYFERAKIEVPELEVLGRPWWE